MAEISSMAIPFFLYLQARPAHSTSLLADSSLSGVKETTCTASWLEITSHTCARQQITIIDLCFTTSQGKGNVFFLDSFCFSLAKISRSEYFELCLITVSRYGT